MKKSKSFYIVLIMIVVSIVGIGYMFLGPTTVDRDLVETVGKEQLLEFKGADLHESKDGKLIWKLKSNNIKYSPRTKDMYLTNVKAELYQNGTTILIDADKASVTENSNLITLIGHVEAKTKEGREFVGDDLIFNVKEQKLETKKSFRYKADGMTITGDKLTGDMVLNKIKAKGHVKIVEE